MHWWKTRCFRAHTLQCDFLIAEVHAIHPYTCLSASAPSAPAWLWLRLCSVLGRRNRMTPDLTGSMSLLTLELWIETAAESTACVQCHTMRMHSLQHRTQCLPKMTTVHQVRLLKLQGVCRLTWLSTDGSSWRCAPGGRSGWPGRHRAGQPQGMQTAPGRCSPAPACPAAQHPSSQY